MNLSIRIIRWLLRLPILLLGLPFILMSELLFAFPCEGKFIQDEYWEAWKL